MKRSGYVESQKGYGIHLQKLLRRRYVRLQHQKMERNMATNGDEEVEKTSEETVVDLLKKTTETWIETVGGAKKGRIYGLGPRNCTLADSLDTNGASSSAPNPPNVPTQQIFETPEFQQLLDRAMEHRMENMLARVQEDIREDMQEKEKLWLVLSCVRCLV